MGKVGIIGGTSLLASSYFSGLDGVKVETDEGTAQLYVSKNSNLVFVQRHHANGDDPDTYLPPHRINHRANMLALKKLGVEKVLGVCSVGSLQQEHPVGTLIVPNDFFGLMCGAISMYDDARSHVVPGLDSQLRADLSERLKDLDYLKSIGTYVQTTGPRFETPAEVKHLSSFGDVVGMTGVSEATMARDIKMPYALICMVDNYANGLVSVPLTEEDFKTNVKLNQKKVEHAVGSMLELWNATVAGAGDHMYVDQVLKERADTLILGKWIIPVVPEKNIMEDTAIVVRNGKISRMLGIAAAMQSFDADQLVDCRKHAIIPGLVNAHTHSGMTLMRGKADDETLFDWLHGTVWPIEAAFVGEPGFCRDGALLSVAEMINGGTTCFSDMYWYPDAAARVAVEVGIRAVIGMCVIGFPSSYASTPNEYIRKGEEARGKFANEDLVSFSYAPHAPYTVPDAVLEGIRDSATEQNSIIHTHLHETKEECVASLALNRDSASCHLSDHAATPVENFRRLGLLNQRLVAAHMVHLTDEEIQIVAEAKVNVVHCPSSNMKLASGFCRTADLLAAGVNVALGTDSAASNNSLDMLQEMKGAALMAKNVAQDSTVVPAHTALRMATLNGAIALGLGEVTGSLEVGKDADVVAVQLGNRAGNSPVYNAASSVVYSATREDVSDVWVRGRQVLRCGALTTMNCIDLLARAQNWAERIHQEVDLSKTSSGTQH